MKYVVILRVEYLFTVVAVIMMAVTMAFLSQGQRVSSMTGGSTSSWRWSRNKSRRKRWND